MLPRVSQKRVTGLPGLLVATRLNLYLLEIFLHFRKLTVKNLYSIFSCFFVFSIRAKISASVGLANLAAILNFSTCRRYELRS